MNRIEPSETLKFESFGSWNDSTEISRFRYFGPELASYPVRSSIYVVYHGNYFLYML